MDQCGDHILQRVLQIAGGGEMDPEKDSRRQAVDRTHAVRGAERPDHDAPSRLVVGRGSRVQESRGVVRQGRTSLLQRLRRCFRQVVGVRRQVLNEEISVFYVGFRINIIFIKNK